MESIMKGMKVAVRMHTGHLKRWQALALSAVIPVIIVFSYYLFSGVFPFGPHTIMTVDLGQQYVDFYEYFRNVAHGQWEQLFYSFQKGYGGEMVGTWAYYLLSPTLWLLALLPQQWLTVGIWLMVLLKIGVAGFSFQFLLLKRYHDHTLGSVLFSLSYALMGYFSANQLNVMWLDAVAVLPFIISGVEQLFQTAFASWRHILPYTLWLAFAMITNYYMGYMICLFLLFYFVFALACHRDLYHTRGRWHWESVRRVSLRFIAGSLLAAGLAAVILLPPLYALGLSKGSYTHFVWKANFNFSLLDFISKFIVGAFNFDQMPEGFPNVFIGSLGVVSFLYYFIDRTQVRSERLITALLAGLLIFTMTQSSLNLIWHGFQSPIWYPYRYSYVVSFFMLYVGYRAFRNQPPLSVANVIGLGGIGAIAFLALTWKLASYNYLTPWQLAISALFYAGVLGFLYLQKHPEAKRGARLLLAMLVVAELSINYLCTLNSLSYLDQDNFVSFIKQTEPLVKQWQSDETTFYRMTKTFQRTKNDAHQLNYYDLNHFNSTLERNATVFFDRLGQPTSDGFINYLNGTLVTDAFFGVRYFLSSNKQQAAVHHADAMTRKDLNSYSIAMNDGEHYTVYENPNALGLGFVAPNAIRSLDVALMTPIELQEQWLSLWGEPQTLVPHTTEAPATYFQVRNYQDVQLINAEAENPQRVNTFYTKKDLSQDAFINVKINIPTDEAYYLTIPGTLDSEEVEFYLNGEKMAYDAAFRHTQVYNIADKAKGTTVTFTLKLKAKQLNLAYLNVYALNTEAFNQVIQTIKTQPFKITAFHNATFSGTVDTNQDNQVLALSMPYNRGWHASVNGQATPTIPLFDGGMTGIPLPTSGHYTITLSYRPPYLLLGGAISVLSLMAILLIRYSHPHIERKKAKQQ